MMEETDIQTIIDRVTFLLKMELNKCNMKYKESMKETSEGILNLPIVKKVIHEYETKISHDTSSDYEISRLKSTVSNLTSEIQDIKKMLLNQKTVLNEEPNIQLKIREINNDESLGTVQKMEEELDNVSELALSEEEDVEEEEEDVEEDISEVKEEIVEEDISEVKEESVEEEVEEDISEVEEEEEDEDEDIEEEIEESEAKDISEAEEKEVVNEVKDISEAEEDEDEDEEVFEIEIDDTSYFTNNEENGILYEIDENGEPGKKVGIIKDGEAIFS